jgi:dihydroxyacetone kinase-like protein
MSTTLSFAQAVALLDTLADDMVAAKDELTQLDAALGDGDLGRTIERGFKAVKEAIPAASAENDLGKFLFKLGKTFSDAAASSFGALLGTAFMKGGMALKGKQTIAPSEIADAMQAALDALMERGKAKVGDKTMLDAMHPAILAIRAAVSSGGDATSIAGALRAGADAAQAGAEQTVNMQSQIGRASWQGERSVGNMDPGARAVALMLASAARYAEQKLN